MMKLYNYYRSSASYRVRIALHYKNVAYQQIPIHLINNGGEQHHPDYLKLNPQQLVPMLQVEHHNLTQSLAIIEYLEEAYPTPALLPQAPVARSIVRSIAQTIACDIHPLNNLRVLNYLTDILHVEEQQKSQWYHHWIALGFTALEKQLVVLARQKDVCYGSDVTMADVVLIPQVYNAKRFAVPLDNYPLITKIYDYCMTLPAFSEASPENNE